MSNSVKDTEASRINNKTSWNINNLFWGLFFILIGGLFLAQNLGWTDIHWRNILFLWPIVIIMAGLSILAVRSLVWRVLLWMVTLASIVVIGLTAIGYIDFTPVNSITSESVDLTSKDVKSAVLSVKAGGSAINIGTKEQSQVVIAELNSNITELKKEVSTRGDVQNVELSMNSSRQVWFGGIRNNLDITIGTKLPTSLAVDYGAAELNIDFTDATISDIKLKSGASSTDLKLGSKSKNIDVSVESGASSTIIRIPFGSGVRLTIDGGLVDKQLANLTDKSSGTYESPNYSASENTVNITAKLGVASFQIERY